MPEPAAVVLMGTHITRPPCIGQDPFPIQPVMIHNIDEAPPPLSY